MTEWDKALRLPWTAAAGRHTETHDRRAHHHESSCHGIFSGFLMRQYLLTTDVTGFCSSVAVLYTLHGERPPAILREVVALFVYFLRQYGRVIVVDYYWVVIGLIALFLLHVRGSSL